MVSKFNSIEISFSKTRYGARLGELDSNRFQLRIDFLWLRLPPGMLLDSRLKDFTKNTIPNGAHDHVGAHQQMHTLEPKHAYQA